MRNSKGKLKSGESDAIWAAVWAVDPFAEDSDLQSSAAVAIQALRKRIELRVRPVYFAAPPMSHPHAELGVDEFRVAHERAQSRLDELVVETGFAPLPIELIEVTERSVNSRVSAVLKYAHERGAKLIFVSTRARRGPARWFLGSFAETLSLRSDIPLFIVNPSWTKIATKMAGKTTDFEEILFPTDFSIRSRNAFEEVLSFARVAKLRLCLFHKFGIDVDPSWDFNLAPSPILSRRGPEGGPEGGKDEMVMIKAQLEKWRQIGERAGVRTAVELEAHPGSIVESILRRAGSAPCVIAMAARSSRIEAVMLGSITRQLIREATTPVWILCDSNEKHEARDQRIVA